MGTSLNGTRVIEIRNVRVVEDPTDPEDNERLRKAFLFDHDCELCGSKGAPVDVYYDFPLLVKRASTRTIQREILRETIGKC